MKEATRPLTTLSVSMLGVVFSMQIKARSSITSRSTILVFFGTRVTKTSRLKSV